jgi:hypothetical protein
MVCFRYIIVNTLHNGDNKDDDDYDDKNKNNNNNFNPRRRRRRKRNSVNTKNVHTNGTFTSNNMFPLMSCNSYYTHRKSRHVLFLRNRGNLHR